MYIYIYTHTNPESYTPTASAPSCFIASLEAGLQFAQAYQLRLVHVNVVENRTEGILIRVAGFTAVSVQGMV